MEDKLPVLPLLWMFTVGLVSAGACREQTDVGDQRDGISATARAAALPGAGDVTSYQQKPNVSPPAALKPQALLDHAVRKLESHDSVSAKIRHQIDLFGKRLAGWGSYLEQRTDGNHLIRLELKIQLGDKTSSLLQVCDGRFLWTYRKLLGKPKLDRIDIARATRALEQAEKTAGQRDMEILPGLGGLPKVLRGLHTSFDFTSAKRGRWGKEKRPVWRLRGRWKPGQLAKLLPDQKAALEEGKSADLSKLPQHLPDHVILLLGQEDLFPYRIEYRRVAEAAGRALVTMDLYDVKINVPIDPNRFIYNPGDLKPSDRTENLLDSLGVKD